MPNGVEDALRERIEVLLVPAATDVRRVKRTILAALDDGRAHRTAWLLARCADTLGAAHLERLEFVFQEQAGPDLIEADAPALTYVRARLAAMRGIGELVVAGVVLPASDPGGDELRHEPLLRSDDVITFGITHPSGRFGVRARFDRPILADSYMVAVPGEARWYLDPDLFAEEIAYLELTERAHRALREALSSFRRGLYLACASLLGVVSEAAWYAAGERIGTPPIAKAIKAEATTRVQKHVAEHLRGVRTLARRPTLPDELLAHARILREIRNYGVHPREIRDDLERYFSEEACGLLLFETHHYLTALAGAAEEAVFDALESAKQA